ncbi:hypothetical protein HMPREF0454_04354 [Hafnia alvei ATCC 51873]|uniref:Uncharacterized protein n=1 Tax=Hafnia alvei ATCC 51873 TaxID=1002364 RepID=G9YCL6_HAFAL|nr:hypothetical protein HMPREF0454_04354 [Hafnia alvei ATCC 51873]
MDNLHHSAWRLSYGKMTICWQIDSGVLFLVNFLAIFSSLYTYSH